MTSCPFCELPSTTDLPRNELAYTRYDKYPVTPGHLLVIPFRHVSNYFEATAEEKQALWALVEEAKLYLDRQYAPDGYNLGIKVGVEAGQTVMHLHLHLIPRYRGDVADPRGGVRGVIPEKQKYTPISSMEPLPKIGEGSGSKCHGRDGGQGGLGPP